MGIGVMQTKNEVFLEQSAYTEALLSRFGMDKANSAATPLDINADLVTTSDEVEECDKHLYQSAVVILKKIFNLFINPTLNPEPAPFATPNTNTGTIPTHHDMESESEQSSTETNDTQDQNSDDTEPGQPWETHPKKKTAEKRKKDCSPLDKHSSPDTYELEATLVKSATQQPPIPTHPTNEWIITEISKNKPKITVEIGKRDPNKVWKQILVNKIHLNQLQIYAIPQQDFDEIPHSPKHLTHKRPKHATQWIHIVT
ncbi:hypothetical protein FHG87_014215 [Trinorchestia longiramus]|nr:hypothetical protein FHG87_014215 [Trinorchestia longiramus]